MRSVPTQTQSALILASAAIWFLGGFGLILLFSNVSDDLHPYRYLLMAAGSATMLLPAFWIRSPAGIWRSMRREAIVEHVARLVLFAFGIVAVIALGLITVARSIAVAAILILVFEGYFVLGIHALGALLARARARGYADHCPTCLYDLTAIESPTCPECGTPITPPRTAATPAPDR